MRSCFRLGLSTRTSLCIGGFEDFRPDASAGRKGIQILLLNQMAW